MLVALDSNDIVSRMIQSERVDPNILCTAGHSAFYMAVIYEKDDILSRMLRVDTNAKVHRTPQDSAP
jgi:hypothetical protein